MDARTLLADLDTLGVRLIQRDDRPSLRFPPGVAGERKAALLAGVAEHREIVLRHFRASTAEAGGGDDPGDWCGECEGWVFGGADGGAVSRLCGRVMCPYWRPGVGPEWLADHRNREAYKRRAGGDHRR